MSEFDKSRRVFLRTAAMGAAAIPMAKLATHSPEAKAGKSKAEDGHALDYVNDASDSDHSAYSDGEQCDNCAFWSGEEENGWGGCQHPDFSDVLVNAEGWCNVYAPGG